MISRVLVLQPFYISINSVLGIANQSRRCSEVLATGLVLSVGTLVALSLEFSSYAVVLGVLLSYLKNLFCNFTASLKKSDKKLNSYSSGVACALSLVYVGVWGTAPESFLQNFFMSAVASYLVSVVPELVVYRTYKETTFQFCYLVVFTGVFWVLEMPFYYGVYFIVNICCLFLNNYSIEQESPHLTQGRTSLLFHILAHKDSQRLSLFLLINLVFMFVEAIYGYMSNSLGLISDSIHMAFDCTALAIGLYASYISKLPPDSEHPYGYHRYEVLSGYINAIFLIFVGLSIFEESVERIMEPPHIETEMLLVVSVLGLLVNLIGLFFFQDYSHDGDNSNLQGVFLHVLADTLGSVGVIISSLVVQSLGWFIVDPICSLVISVLIFLSVMPLLKDSISQLLERDMDKKRKVYLKQLLDIGDLEVEELFVWKLAGEEYAAMAWVKALKDQDLVELTQKCKQVLPHWNAVQVS